MKNISSIKSAAKSESPKTPGGISKSLLTPCRRVGLSRNWKKAGPSPFVSPLSGATPIKEEVTVEKKPSRKRKERIETEENKEEDKCTPDTPISNDEVLDVDAVVIAESSEGNDVDLSSTPTRHIEVPRKKKSKTLLAALNRNDKEKDEKVVSVHCVPDIPHGREEKNDVDVNIQLDIEPVVVTPVQKSRSKKKNTISSKVTPKATLEHLKEDDLKKQSEDKDNLVNKGVIENMTPLKKIKSKNMKSVFKKSKEMAKNNEIEEILNVEKQEECVKEIIEDSNPKTKSPNELTKECIVVIQKKIFKADLMRKKEKPKSETFDSDSDDVPLGQMNKEKVDELTLGPKETPEKMQKEIPKEQEIINLVDKDEDFIETKKIKVNKLEDKATSIGGLKKKSIKNTKLKTQTHKPLQQTQNIDFDDEDDFDFDNKKTILIRKTYEKVVKPQRAKSTGSITQKDIDDLKARIEAKKKMLLARAMTDETEELRSLIKKWQKGCQDALMELMELMKTKCADRPNMDYSEMLSLLNIPANLVGYDAENDCFNTPNDTNIVLSNFND